LLPLLISLNQMESNTLRPLFITETLTSPTPMPRQSKLWAKYFSRMTQMVLSLSLVLGPRLAKLRLFLTALLSTATRMTLKSIKYKVSWKLIIEVWTILPSGGLPTSRPPSVVLWTFTMIPSSQDNKLTLSSSSSPTELSLIKKKLSTNLLQRPSWVSLL